MKYTKKKCPKHIRSYFLTGRLSKILFFANSVVQQVRSFKLGF